MRSWRLAHRGRPTPFTNPRNRGKIAPNRNLFIVLTLPVSCVCPACVRSAEKRPSPAGVAGAATPGETEEGLSGVGRLEDMFEPRGPVSVLLDLAEKEAKLEEDRGADTRSPLLQALVQVSFFTGLRRVGSPSEGGERGGSDGKGGRTGVVVFAWSDRRYRMHQAALYRSTYSQSLNIDAHPCRVIVCTAFGTWVGSCTCHQRRLVVPGGYCPAAVLR